MLKQLMERYCERQSLQLDEVSFFRNRRRLCDTQTPGELEMEDDDSIDAVQTVYLGGEGDGCEHLNLLVEDHEVTHSLSHSLIFSYSHIYTHTLSLSSFFLYFLSLSLSHPHSLALHVKPAAV